MSVCATCGLFLTPLQAPIPPRYVCLHDTCAKTGDFYCESCFSDACFIHDLHGVPFLRVDSEGGHTVVQRAVPGGPPRRELRPEDVAVAAADVGECIGMCDPPRAVGPGAAAEGAFPGCAHNHNGNSDKQTMQSKRPLCDRCACQFIISEYGPKVGSLGSSGFFSEGRGILLRCGDCRKIAEAAVYGGQAARARVEARRAWLAALRAPGGGVGAAAAAAAAAAAPAVGVAAAALGGGGAPPPPAGSDEGDSWRGFLANLGDAFKSLHPQPHIQLAGFAALAFFPRAPGAPDPLPPRLCAGDGGFTRDTMVTRVPAILEATLAANPAAPPAFAMAVRAELVVPLRGGAALPPPPPVAAGAEGGEAAGVDWEGEPLWCPRYAEANPRAAASWWWQENAVYQHLLRLWRAHGCTGDPFAAQKAAALEGAAATFRAALAPLVAEAAPPDKAEWLRKLLYLSLWGNRGDLSLSAGRVVPLEGVAAAAGAELLCDDTERAAKLLLAVPQPRVVIVLDNCGLELLADLALVDALLRLGAAVVLHAKQLPTFVSDATPDDVGNHIAWLQARGEDDALAGRLSAALETGALRVAAHPFWNAGRAFWEMPAALREELGASSLASQ